MPIYEYYCQSCGETFERFQKITEDPLSKCPKCGKAVKRLISQTSFTLKGEGWYRDGYAAKPESPKKDEGHPPAPNKDQEPSSGPAEASAKAGGTKNEERGTRDKGRVPADGSVAGGTKDEGGKKEAKAKTEKESKKTSDE